MVFLLKKMNEGWAFDAVVKTLLGRLASHIGVPTWHCGLHACFRLHADQLAGREQVMARVVGPCHPCEMWMEFLAPHGDLVQFWLLQEVEHEQDEVEEAFHFWKILVP